MGRNFKVAKEAKEEVEEQWGSIGELKDEVSEPSRLADWS